MTESRGASNEVSSTSRRDLLKMTGAATLAGATAIAAGAETAGAATRRFPSASSAGLRVAVQINGVAVAGLISVDSIESTSDVTYELNSGTGTITSNPGTPTVQAVVLSKDWSNTSEWYKWRKAVLDGKVDRRSVSVIFLNDAGKVSARMNFYNCWPSKWKGPELNARSSGHAGEKLEISWETMELKSS